MPLDSATELFRARLPITAKRGAWNTKVLTLVIVLSANARPAHLVRLRCARCVSTDFNYITFRLAQTHPGSAMASRERNSSRLRELDVSCRMEEGLEGQWGMFAASVARLVFPYARSPS